MSINADCLKSVLLDAILETLRSEGVNTVQAASKRLGISLQQTRYIYKRQGYNIGLMRLIECCDTLHVVITARAAFVPKE